MPAARTTRAISLASPFLFSHHHLAHDRPWRHDVREIGREGPECDRGDSNPGFLSGGCEIKSPPMYCYFPQTCVSEVDRAAGRTASLPAAFAGRCDHDIACTARPHVAQSKRFSTGFPPPDMMVYLHRGFCAVFEGVAVLLMCRTHTNGHLTLCSCPKILLRELGRTRASRKHGTISTIGKHLGGTREKGRFSSLHAH